MKSCITKKPYFLLFQLDAPYSEKPAWLIEFPNTLKNGQARFDYIYLSIHPHTSTTHLGLYNRNSLASWPCSILLAVEVSQELLLRAWLMR